MYCISDQQIDFILSDISARGVETESLQLNLLDHICCIIERELEDNGDFERFYNSAIRRFYKESLSEIEEETHLLLTNKNYYVMKKIMIYSGVFSAVVLTAGIILKYMHSPGSAALITVGIGTASLFFLPLMFILKIKEKQQTKDKVLAALGSVSAITIAMSILFKIMHWPGANLMGLSSVAILVLLFLPIYFFTGIRNADSKVNTIVTSVLIVLGCGLFFTLTITPKSTRLITIRNTNSYLRSEQILSNEAQQVAVLQKATTANNALAALSTQIYTHCEAVKAELVAYATGGSRAIDKDFENKNIFIEDWNTHDCFANNKEAETKLEELTRTVARYNEVNAQLHLQGLQPIPVNSSVINRNEIKVQDRVTNALTDLQQIQMLVLQNQRALTAPQSSAGLTAMR